MKFYYNCFYYILILQFLVPTLCLNNVVIIIVDDLRPAIGAYGDTLAKTPNIDNLAKNGVLFKRVYAQQALCGPSRTSFLTSRRPDTLRQYDVHKYWRNNAGNFTTIPQYFKEHGYNTMSIGKVFHPGLTSNHTDDYPLSWTWPAWHPPSEKYKNAPLCSGSDGWFANLVCPVDLWQQPNQTLPDLQSVDEAVKFINLQSNEVSPFFLAVGFHKPHIPLKFPNKYLAQYSIDDMVLPPVRQYPAELPTVAWNPWNDVRGRHDITKLNITYPFGGMPDEWAKKIQQAYYSSVTYIDDLIGQLLESLLDNGLDGNTVVALFGDHGWSLGEHGEWSKYSNFEISVRVPLIIKAPKVIPHKKINSDLVELVDIMPTLVDLAGLPQVHLCSSDPESASQLCTEGRSLLPLMLGRASGWRQAACSQYPRPGVFPSQIPDSDQPRMEEITIMGYSIRTGRHRYTEWVSWNFTTMSSVWSAVKGTQLYDHLIDPEENMNLAGRPAMEDVAKVLKALLRESFPLS